MTRGEKEPGSNKSYIWILSEGLVTWRRCVNNVCSEESYAGIIWVRARGIHTVYLQVILTPLVAIVVESVVVTQEVSHRTSHVALQTPRGRKRLLVFHPDNNQMQKSNYIYRRTVISPSKIKYWMSV